MTASETPPSIPPLYGAAAGADAFISQDGNLKKIREIPVLSLHELP